MKVRTKKITSVALKNTSREGGRESRSKRGGGVGFGRKREREQPACETRAAEERHSSGRGGHVDKFERRGEGGRHLIPKGGRGREKLTVPVAGMCLLPTALLSVSL